MAIQQTVTEIEADLAEAIVSVLRLEINPAIINPEAPLFGDGLGLDSIDALEIAVCIWERYGIKLRSDDPNIKRIFGSLRSLAEHIAAHLPRSARGAVAASS